MMKNLGIFLGLGAMTTIAAMGCEDVPGKRIVIPVAGGGGFGLGNFITGEGVGEDCSSEPCRSGLSCNDESVCEPAGTLGAGELCVIGPECEDGLICSVPPSCDPSNPLSCAPACIASAGGELGSECTTDIQCGSGLRCGLNGFSAECVPAGDADLGQACVAQNDCFQGLYCADGECSLPEPPIGVPLWDGVACDEPDDDRVEALFHVPGAEGSPADADLFQLPFPNDIRLTEAGRPDLDGFPTPGAGLLGVDIVQAYVDAVEENAQGWSTSPTFIFRFSGGLDLGSLANPDIDVPMGEQYPLGERRVVVIDVDNLPVEQKTDDTPNTVGYRTNGTSYSTGSRTNYVCDDWFALRMQRATLVPNHRYVAYITTAAKSEKGGDIARSEQFAAMLADSAPSGDSALADAYEAYAPLRELVDFYEGTNNEIDPDEILTAAVITTGDVVAPMRTLAAAVEAADAPTASNWVKCGGGATSPCPQAEGSRACGEGTDDYDEYQALLEIPIFQKGEAPYLSEGGEIASEPERREQICVSMSIPKDDEPADGWPLVIYGHGTGGSYRGPIRESVAGELARTTPKFATMGFDEVQHGPRRGTGEGSDQEPDNLFFNFLNPEAARGNPLQGAADVLSVLRFARSGTLASAVDTGDIAINVNQHRVYLFGHSQGSTHGSMALPFSQMTGGVLSGNGGGLAEALMNKTNPVNIAEAIPFVVQDIASDGSLRMGDKHPVLALLQHYIDPADPVNFAALLADRPEMGMGPKSVLQTFGLNDTYSPPATLARFIYAAESMELAPAPSGVSPTGDNILGIAEAAGAVSGNISAGEPAEPAATLVCRQYAPASGEDGHFVVHDVDDANADAIGFLSALGQGALPTVPAP